MTKNDLFGRLLNYVAKEDKKLKEGESLSTINILDVDKSPLLEIDAFFFIFIRAKVNLFNKETKDYDFLNEREIMLNEFPTIIDWIQACYDYRSENTYEGLITPLKHIIRAYNAFVFKGFEEEYKDFMTKIPIKFINELVVEPFVINIDGSRYYFLQDLDQMSIHILITSFIRHLSENEDKYFDMLAVKALPNIVRNMIVKSCKKFLKDGLPEGENDIQTYINSLVPVNFRKYKRENGHSEFMQSFFEYLEKVPVTDNPSRPAEFKRKYKELLESELNAKS